MVAQCVRAERLAGIVPAGLSKSTSLGCARRLLILGWRYSHRQVVAGKIQRRLPRVRFVANVSFERTCAFPTRKRAGGCGSAKCRPTQVINYLTRYLTGGPISPARIVRADAEQVTLLAREGQRTGGDRRQTDVTLALVEFIRRWCLHIQPPQLTKTRYLGGWSCSKRAAYMARCRRLLAQPEATHHSARPDQPSFTETVDSSQPRLGSLENLCSHCGSERLQLVGEMPKPSWNYLLRPKRRDCPAWYRTHRIDEDRQFWDTVQSAGFYDWYLEEVVERAEQPVPLEAEPPTPMQLYFAGIGS